MQRNPFQYPRRAAPPLAIPTPPKVARLVRPGLPPAAVRRPCGLCNRVRSWVGLGPRQ
jgi:hypothetical protein